MRAGEIVTFGSFEQDGKTGNGKEPIEWIVLDYDSETNRSLLISRYGLSVEKFQMGNWQTEYCGWANSTARSYMSIFYNRAFTEDEKNRIAETVVRTDGYADSTDKVFLLSAEEAEKYRKSVLAMSNYDLYALSLVKSAEENEYEYLDYYTYSWWLRSPVEGASKNVAIVRGNSISSAEVTAWAAYRPAIWLRLDEE